MYPRDPYSNQYSSQNKSKLVSRNHTPTFSRNTGIYGYSSLNQQLNETGGAYGNNMSSNMGISGNKIKISNNMYGSILTSGSNLDNNTGMPKFKFFNKRGISSNNGRTNIETSNNDAYSNAYNNIPTSGNNVINHARKPKFSLLNNATTSTSNDRYTATSVSNNRHNGGTSEFPSLTKMSKKRDTSVTPSSQIKPKPKINNFFKKIEVEPIALPDSKPLVLYDHNDDNMLKRVNEAGSSIIKSNIRELEQCCTFSAEDGIAFNGRIVILAHGSRGGGKLGTVNGRNAKTLSIQLDALLKNNKTFNIKLRRIDILACHVGAYENGSYIKAFVQYFYPSHPNIKEVWGTQGTTAYSDFLKVNVMEYNYVTTDIRYKQKSKGQIVSKILITEFLADGEIPPEMRKNQKDIFERVNHTLPELPLYSNTYEVWTGMRNFCIK